MRALTTTAAPVNIAGIAIRTDAVGRFSLNDLHKAAGGEARHRPSLWMANASTQALIDEIEREAGIPASATIKGGTETGTFVVRELVYGFAMWVSPAFHLKVIRAYDAIASGTAQPLNPALSRRDILKMALDSEERAAELQAQVDAAAPKLAALARLADADGTMTLTETAKALKIGRKSFIAELQARGWLYRSGSGSLLGYEERIERGHLTHRATTYESPNTGETRIAHQVLVTAKGLAKLAEIFASERSA